MWWIDHNIIILSVILLNIVLTSALQALQYPVQLGPFCTLTLYFKDNHFKASEQQTTYENVVGKEEIACNEQFPLFPQCFLLNQKIVSPFLNISDILSSFAAELEELKIGIWGKGLSFGWKKKEPQKLDQGLQITWENVHLETSPLFADTWWIMRTIWCTFVVL